MAQPAAVLSILVTANTTQATRGLNQLNTNLKKTESTATKARGELKTLAKGAGIGALVLGAHQAVGAFVDFDRSMRNVNSIAKLSEKRFDSLSKEVLKLAGPTAQSPKTLADGLYQLVSSGFDANQSLKILSKTAVAATAGLTDTATATQVVAAAINSYGLSAKDAGHVSDVLFKTVDKGVITFEELAQSLGPVLPAANSLNVSLEQVGAALATLTKQGFPAAEAATAVDAAMRALLKPSEDMKKAFKELGVAGGEELVRKYGSLQAALVAVAKTTDGSGAAMNKLFNEIRGARGALTLTGANARGAAKDLDALGRSSGATAKAFNEQAKSAAVQWQRLKAQVQAFEAEVGAVLFPIIRRAIIILLAWDKILIKLPMLWIAVGKAGVQAAKAIVGAVKSAFETVKKLAGDVIAFVLRRFADLFDVAAKLPIIGDKFKGIADDVRRAASRVDKLGENIKDLPVEKELTLKVKLALEDLSGVPRLRDLSGGPSGGPPSTGQMMDGIMSAGKKRTREWLVNHLDEIAPLLGAPGSAPGQLGLLERIGHQMGLVTSSGYRPGDPGFHGQNRARDLAGSAGAMLRYARLLYTRFGTTINELIHTPLGVGIDNHRAGPLTSLYPASTLADHYDHVHVALQRGGGVGGSGSGDRVPALLEPGEFVMNRKATRVALPLLAALNRGIPRFQNGGLAQTVRALGKAGASKNEQITLAAISGAESRWRDIAGDGGASVSRYQIHKPSWAVKAQSLGYNLNTLAGSTRMALWIARNSGYQNWTMYRNRQWLNFRDDVIRYLEGPHGRDGRRVLGSGRLVNGILTDRPGRRRGVLDRISPTHREMLNGVPAPRPVINVGQPLKGEAGDTGGDAFLDAINQQTAATEAHTQALLDLRLQQARNEALIRAQGPSLERALLSFVSMGLGNKAAGGRLHPGPPGLGSLSRA